eukprot:6212384-Pleurochrysis_carterae.AAC.5
MCHLGKQNARCAQSFLARHGHSQRARGLPIARIAMGKMGIGVERDKGTRSHGLCWLHLHVPVVLAQLG